MRSEGGALLLAENHGPECPLLLCRQLQPLQQPLQRTQQLAVVPRLKLQLVVAGLLSSTAGS